MTKQQRRQCVNACRRLATNANWRIETRGKKWLIDHGSDLCPSYLEPTQVLGKLLCHHLTDRRFKGLDLAPADVRALVGEENIFHLMPRELAGHHESMWLLAIAPELET